MTIPKEKTILAVVSVIFLLLVPAIMQLYKASGKYGDLQEQVLILDEQISTGPYSISSSLIALNDRMQELEIQMHDTETRLSTIQNCFFEGK